MQIYQVPFEALSPASSKESDSDRFYCLDCHTVVRRWEAMAAIKSERAKYLAAGISLGVVFSLLLMVLL